MNPLLHWLTSPEWALVVKALLHSLWQGALIAMGLAMLFRRMVSPSARYHLALAGLGAVMVAGLITWGVLNTPKTFAPAITPMSEPVATAPVVSEPAEKIVVVANWTPARQPMQWTAWLALAWLIGVSAMLGRASVKVAGAEQLRRSCQPLADSRIADLVAAARRAVKLTRQVRVAVTDQLTSPAVVGVLVPTLILPLSLITTLSPEQIRFVLLHELAHIRRGDYLANLFQLFAEALLFFNPAVWWLSHQIRREREACCDALAIELSGAPADYARTLVSVAETMLTPSPAAAPAFGNDREPSSLSDRVQRVLVPGYQPSLRLTWRAMLVALVVGGALLGLLAVGTRQTVVAALGGTSESRSLDPKNVPFPFIPVGLKPDFLMVEEAALGRVMPEAADASQPWILTAKDISRLQPLLLRTGAKPFSSAEPLTGNIVSGMDCLWRIGGISAGTNNTINYLTMPLVEGGKTNARVVGVDATFSATAAGWFPMEFGMVPMVQTNGTFCQLRMAVGGTKLKVSTTIPAGGGLVWATPGGVASKGFRQLVVLRQEATPADKESDVGRPSATNQPAESLLSLPKPEAANDSTVNPTTDLPEGGGTNLVTRIFKVDPKEFAQTLGMVGPVANTNLAESLQMFVRKLGVDVQSPGRTMFYKDGTGMLFVHATPHDLDVIEQALVVMNAKPPQVNIRAMFVEVPANKEGILLGNLGLAGSNFLSSARPGGKVLQASNCFTGILTAPQFKDVAKALRANPDVTVLSGPDVTTLSGRQAQIQTADIHTIVTGVSSVVTNGVTTNIFQTTAMPFGPVLDVIPSVSADGYTVQMTLIPTVTEFVGYEKPDPEVTKFARSKSVDAQLPLPIFRVRQATTSAVVWDGQTIVMGGFVSELKTLKKSKVPVLGDLPFVSRLFRSESTHTEKKSLFVFVTPTIIDQAGNRAHPDEEVPSGRAAVPKQNSVK